MCPFLLEEKNCADKYVAAAAECQLGEFTEIALRELGVLVFKIPERRRQKHCKARLPEVLQSLEVVPQKFLVKLHS